MEITIDTVREASKNKILSYTFDDAENSVQEEYNRVIQEIYSTAKKGYTDFLYYYDPIMNRALYELVLRVLRLDGFEITRYEDITSFVNVGW